MTTSLGSRGHQVDQKSHPDLLSTAPVPQCVIGRLHMSIFPPVALITQGSVSPPPVVRACAISLCPAHSAHSPCCAPPISCAMLHVILALCPLVCLPISAPRPFIACALSRVGARVFVVCDDPIFPCMFAHFFFPTIVANCRISSAVHPDKGLLTENVFSVCVSVCRC